MPGSELTDFPRPSVAVDVALLTVQPAAEAALGERLAVLLQKRSRRPRGPVLPGRLLREGETLADAVAATFHEKVGLDISEAEPRLLGVYDAPGRDERGWVISALHVLALPWSELDQARGSIVPVDLDGRLADGQRLVFDHAEMLVSAVRRMRRHYEDKPDPYRLLGDTFTLGQLRELHEGVLGEELLKDTFNRRMKQYVEELVVDGQPVRQRETGGRPAQVYVRADDGELTERERRRLLLPRR